MSFFQFSFNLESIMSKKCITVEFKQMIDLGRNTQFVCKSLNTCILYEYIYFIREG